MQKNGKNLLYLPIIRSRQKLVSHVVEINIPDGLFMSHIGPEKCKKNSLMRLILHLKKGIIINYNQRSGPKLLVRIQIGGFRLFETRSPDSDF
jgi:hypothetical protein